MRLSQLFNNFVTIAYIWTGLIVVRQGGVASHYSAVGSLDKLNDGSTFRTHIVAVGFFEMSHGIADVES